MLKRKVVAWIIFALIVVLVIFGVPGNARIEGMIGEDIAPRFSVLALCVTFLALVSALVFDMFKSKRGLLSLDSILTVTLTAACGVMSMAYGLEHEISVISTGHPDEVLRTVVGEQASNPLVSAALKDVRSQVESLQKGLWNTEGSDATREQLNEFLQAEAPGSVTCILPWRKGARFSPEIAEILRDARSLSASFRLLVIAPEANLVGGARRDAESAFGNQVTVLNGEYARGDREVRQFFDSHLNSAFIVVDRGRWIALLWERGVAGGYNGEFYLDRDGDRYTQAHSQLTRFKGIEAF